MTLTTENAHARMCPILVVDDDEGMRETTKELLQLEGFRVETARDGKVGLQLLENMERPCLILLDLMMPVMNGWEFLDALHTRYAAQLASIPVAVVSALDEAREVGSKYGCEVLKKPFNIQQLLKTAEHHCCGPEPT